MWLLVVGDGQRGFHKFKKRNLDAVTLRMFSGDAVSREHVEGRCRGEGPSRLLHPVEWCWHCPDCRFESHREYYLHEHDERTRTHQNMHAACDCGRSEVLCAHGLPEAWRTDLPDAVWD